MYINTHPTSRLKMNYDTKKCAVRKKENNSVTKNAALNGQRSALSFGINIVHHLQMGEAIKGAQIIDETFKKLRPEFFQSIEKQCDNLIGELDEFKEGLSKRDFPNMVEEKGDMWQIALSILRDSKLSSDRVLDLRVPQSAKFNKSNNLVLGHVVGVCTDCVQKQCDYIKSSVNRFKEILKGSDENKKVDALKTVFQKFVELSSVTQICPKEALSHNVSKVNGRFQLIEQQAGRKLEHIAPFEFPTLWESAKKTQKSRGVLVG